MSSCAQARAENTLVLRSRRRRRLEGRGEAPAVLFARADQRDCRSGRTFPFIARQTQVTFDKALRGQRQKKPREFSYQAQRFQRADRVVDGLLDQALLQADNIDSPAGRVD